MQCSRVSAKIKEGSTASDVIETDPKIRAKSVLSPVQPVNCHCECFIVEQLQLIIPDRLLLALTELLSGNAAQDQNGQSLKCSCFKITESNWCCFLEQTGNDPWFFCPFDHIDCDSAVILDDFDAVDMPWSINRQLSEQVQDLVRAMGYSRLDLPSNEICVIYCKSFGNVLGVRCNNLKLVATTLLTWGKPPVSVILDWQNQLDSLKEQPTRPSTAETLVTEDGLLIPLTELLNQIDGKVRAKFEGRTAFGNPPIREAASLFRLAPGWPDRTTPMVSDYGFSLAVLKCDQNELAGTLPRKRKSHVKMLCIGSVAAIIFIPALTIRLLSPLTSLEELVATSSDPKALTPTPDLSDEATAINDPKEVELQELVITTDVNRSISESLQPDLTIEALLAQLRPSNERSSTLDNLSLSSIISETLSPTGKVLPTIPTDELAVNEIEVAGASETKDLVTVLSERGTILLERPLRIRSAITKETVTIGKPVLVKECRCEIELKLTEKLVVEPTEKVTIEGASKASWKIAIEDEEPELVFEIASKPGSKWQLTAAVGLRERSGTIPIWLGPREAQFVGSRLIDYRQQIRSAIETLRKLRSHSRGGSNFDFPGEIKKLERHEKEAEKAIDRWKVIARLSHFFFDGNEVQIQFTAIGKP
ncbi:MAG TPA: hypothetical protein VM260_23240 [Pirellula sp.]|nr:hypothetical protein [Pirellula sp.]